MNIELYNMEHDFKGVLYNAPNCLKNILSCSLSVTGIKRAMYYDYMYTSVGNLVVRYWTYRGGGGELIVSFPLNVESAAFWPAYRLVQKKEKCVTVVPMFEPMGGQKKWWKFWRD